MKSDVFGRYELQERLGVGGMAEVFRARDTKRKRLVALKRMLPGISGDDEFLRMFEDEGRIASHLKHPYIARMLKYGRTQGAYYIAFEFVDGRELGKVMEQMRQTPQDPAPFWFFFYVFERVAEGLAYAHARRDDRGVPFRIIHRDISPQNIMISYDGDIKLIDFGIAKARGRLVSTRKGALKGKFGYMAPEQMHGGPIDQRADIFSLGICMWELLTLERLFDGDNEALVMKKLRDGPIPPPSSLRTGVPPELDRIVLKALSRDVNERYRNAEDLYLDLHRLSHDMQAQAVASQVAHTMRLLFVPSPTGSLRHPATTGRAGYRLSMSSVGLFEVDPPPVSAFRRYRTLIICALAIVLLLSGGWWGRRWIASTWRSISPMKTR